MRHFNAPFAVILAAIAQPAMAQDRLEMLGALKPGRTIRVRVHDGGRMRAVVLGARGDSLFLMDGSLAAVTIDSLWVMGRVTVTGALVGLVALPAFVSLSRLCELSDEPNPCSDQASLIVASAVGGAVWGALIGSLIHKWHLRYAWQRTLSVGPEIAPRLGLRVSISLP